MSAPGRHRPEADGLRQATDSPQGLSVSGLSPKGEYRSAQHEGTPVSKAALMPDFGAGLAPLYQEVCRDWPRGIVPADFYTLPKAQTATLLLSGGLDPVTPPRHGERVATNLGPLAHHEVVPNAGHGLLSLGCVRDLVFRFIDALTDAEALQVKAGCARDIPRPPAFVPLGAALPQ